MQQWKQRKALFHIDVLLPKTFVQLFMRARWCLVLWCWCWLEPLLAGRARSSKLVLAESGARLDDALHSALPTLANVNPP